MCPLCCCRSDTLNAGYWLCHWQSFMLFMYVLFDVIYVCIIWCYLCIILCYLCMYYLMLFIYVLFDVIYVCIIWCYLFMYHLMLFMYVLFDVIYVCIIWCYLCMYYLMFFIYVFLSLYILHACWLKSLCIDPLASDSAPTPSLVFLYWACLRQTSPPSLSSRFLPVKNKSFLLYFMFRPWALPWNNINC